MTRDVSDSDTGIFVCERLGDGSFKVGLRDRDTNEQTMMLMTADRMSTLAYWILERTEDES